MLGEMLGALCVPIKGKELLLGHRETLARGAKRLLRVENQALRRCVPARLTLVRRGCEKIHLREQSLGDPGWGK